MNSYRIMANCIQASVFFTEMQYLKYVLKMVFKTVRGRLFFQIQLHFFLNIYTVATQYFACMCYSKNYVYMYVNEFPKCNVTLGNNTKFILFGSMCILQKLVSLIFT